ncbi:MAG TPA: ABC transporter ATP-binding protein [Hypericibacter adhaerens]|uniref:ABC transporter ATP-binding protein n=1 Tax=Hypericibacter adhaerens TaxID=2602016 RepID=UPI002D0F945A|nr:ABC transporter ATP-binding protein [Hypericibacter adhaerens]HWA43504.1 ABC transporter ATP-binding protein [Hypericibacter adhaerens]
MTEPRPPVLELQNASISYFTRAGEINVVPDISFRLEQGEALGLVGESGCGKSTVAFAIMRYLGGAGRLKSGKILFEGRDMGCMSEAELRSIRGSKMAMVYQDPMSSLNPVMPVGRQLMEVPIIHQNAGEAEARARALAMLAEVNLPDPRSVFARYPHQLSGGQQQRVVIAMALMSEPSLLVMDEPTTGLDVTVEAAVLDLVARLRAKHNSAIVFISHNLGTVVRVCDRIGVMYAGELAEEGPIGAVFRNPRHPYTRGLLDCIPVLGSDKRSSPLLPIPGQVPPALNRPAGCVFAPRCKHAEPDRCTTARIPTLAVAGEAGHRVQCLREAELPPYRRPTTQGAAAAAAKAPAEMLAIEGLRKTYHQSGGLFGKTGGYDVKALNDVSVAAPKGTTLAIVGESGCGKSTLAKVLTGLEQATGGQVRVAGVELADMAVERRPIEVKRSLQMVFQNPDSTLNPSHSIGYAIERSLRRLKRLAGGEARGEARRLMETVKLPADFVQRKPRQLSGGQKQRVAIARALAGDPDLMVADEPVSALDVSVQAAIVNLLIEIQKSREATLVFISHDLSVVRYLADRVAVMYLGKIVEFGSVEDVFAPPYHPYTEALLSAVPVPDPDIKQTRVILEGSIPSPTDLPAGCPFATRCPRKVGAICDTTPPPEQKTASGHRIACHIPLDDLTKVAPVVRRVAE